MTGRRAAHPSEFDQCAEGRWYAVGRRVLREKATQYDVDSHAEKQERSYADAWRYFEVNGYDMSDVLDQYIYTD